MIRAASGEDAARKQRAFPRLFIAARPASDISFSSLCAAA